MKRLPFLLFLALGAACPFVRSAEPIEVPVWPGEAPGSEGASETEAWQERGTNGVVDRAIRQIHRPTITVFLPKPGDATGVGVLIVPGGGFEHLAYDKEGCNVARWLASRGIAGFVLKYRLPKTPGHAYTVETAAADVLQAETVLRSRAAEWGVDPAKVGILGFSVGGDLTALVGTRTPPEFRPAFVALLYAHPLPDDFGGPLASPPPAFIAQAADDTHSRDNSLKLFQWLRSNKGEAELHIFSAGGEGYGLGKPGTPVAAWPALFDAWLGANGFVSQAQSRAAAAPAEPASAPSRFWSLLQSDHPTPAGSTRGRSNLSQPGTGSP